MDIVGDDRLASALESLDWEVVDGQLVKVVKRADFAQALAYVNEVGALAEEAGHHPDIDLRWDTVTLHLMTHARGAITDADLALAEKIDALG